MFEFYEKRRFKRMLYSRLTLALLLVPFTLMASAAWNAFEKERSSRVHSAEAAAELAELQSRESALREEIERLNTAQGIEEEIRSKYDVGREGEKLVVIVTPAAPPAPETPVPETGFWAKLKGLFLRE